MHKDDLTKWVCIGRTGSFKDSNGIEHTFTVQNFNDLTKGYNPTKAEAPLCFGHPKDSDPAVGWVRRLKCEGDKLLAQFACVPANVKKLVEDGFYRYVSMSLTPDKKRLLHVGLLGAVPPAIDGLGPVDFNSTEEATIQFSFSYDNELNGGNMNLDELQLQIEQLTEKLNAVVAENEKLKVQLAELEQGKNEATKKAEEAAAEFSAYQNKVETEQREARIRNLVNSGRIKPAEEQDVLSFAVALSTAKTSVNFSAANGKTEIISPEEKYLRELEAREVSPMFASFAAYAPKPGHIASAATQLPTTSIVNKL